MVVVVMEVMVMVVMRSDGGGDRRCGDGGVLVIRVVEIMVLW